MSLYSREDYEQEIELLEKTSQSVSRWIVAQEEEGNRGAGLQSIIFTTHLEAQKRNAKGRLLATRSMLMDAKSKSACAEPSTHAKGCKCKRYKKFRELEEKEQQLRELVAQRDEVA